ncbi:ATP-binding protein [Mycolicibacterium sp. XJ1819]
MSPAQTRGSVDGYGTDITRFVGRRRERAEVRRLLSVSRLVTITGFGGVGKTRLAVKCSVDLHRAFRDGVWFVDLATLSDPVLLPDRLATTFGLGTQASGRTTDAVVEFLADRAVLLIMDNCEHLLGRCAELCARLLQSCAQLHVLATSREPLGVMGEAILPIAPMPVPDADTPFPEVDDVYDGITLFLDRARMARPDLELDEADKGAIAEICRRLDGIPLALELAAVRLRGLSPPQLLDQVSGRFQLLNSGNRGAPERQRTLRDCVEWSYELCTPAEQALWAQISVFSGAIEVEAVAAVAAVDEGAASDQAVVELLLSLVNKSVLTCEPSGEQMSYRMLEVIRDFGKEKLRESGALDEFRRRHCEYFLAMASRSEDQWGTEHQAHWIARLNRNHPNLQAALQFCLADTGRAEAGLQAATGLSLQWLTAGAVGEGRHWLDLFLASASEISEVALCRALCTVARLAMTQGDLVTSTEYLERGRGLAQNLSPESTAYLDQASAMRALYCAEWDDAVEYSERAMAVFEPAGALTAQLTCMMIAQMAHGAAGRTEEALTVHRECLQITERTGDTWFRSYSLWNAGVLQWLAGETDPALRTIRDSLRTKQGLVDIIGVVSCLEGLAWVLAGQEPRRAAVLLGACSALWEKSGAKPEQIAAISTSHDRSVDHLLESIGPAAYRRLHNHGRTLSREEAVALALNDKPVARTGTATASSPLTRREHEVAELVARGLSNRDIANSLVISQRTAETHVERILTKCGFRSRTQIATWLHEQQSGAR